MAGRVALAKAVRLRHRGEARRRRRAERPGTRNDAQSVPLAFIKQDSCANGISL